MPGGLGGTTKRPMTRRHAYPSVIESVGRNGLAHVVRAVHGAPLSIRFVAPGTAIPGNTKSKLGKAAAAAKEEDQKRRIYTTAVFSRTEAKELRTAADDAAKTMGGWAPRGRGCCTDDVLVCALPARSRYLVCRAFKERLMPLVCELFPEANLRPDSLPAERGSFFVIKYTAQSRPNFGLHTDGSAVTVNVALSDERKNGSVADDEFSGGGTYFPARGSCASSGMLMKPDAGVAILHDGKTEHAGSRVTAGARYVLVGFFYGSEAPPSPGLTGLKSAGVHLTGWLQGMERGWLQGVDALPKSAAAPLPLCFPDDVSGSGRNGAKHRDGCSLLNCFERFVVADDDADLIPDDKIQIGVDAD